MQLDTGSCTETAAPDTGQRLIVFASAAIGQRHTLTLEGSLPFRLEIARQCRLNHLELFAEFYDERLKRARVRKDWRR